MNLQTSSIILKINFKDEKKEIMNMTEAIKLEYQEKMNKVVEEFRIHQETINSKIKDKYQRLQEKLKKHADTQVSRFHKEIDVFSSNSQEKSAIDQNNKNLYNTLEKQIKSMKKKKREVQRKFEEIKG